MMKGVLLLVMVCIGIELMLPKTRAYKKKALIDALLEENKITPARKNYLVPRYGSDGNMRRADPIGPAFKRRPFEASPGDLPDLLDYANMLKNDIVLLDNSVETRTRKRGNVKSLNHAIPLAVPASPCSCESSKQIISLGPNYYPQYVESRNCNKGSCPMPYRCKAEHYSLTVLKARSFMDEESHMEMPEGLYTRWVAKTINVTTGCVCTRDSDI